MRTHKIQAKLTSKPATSSLLAWPLFGTNETGG